jgi:hypothetical protein
VSPAEISAAAQVDWIVHRESSQNEVSQDGQPLNDDRFLLRRARLRAEKDEGLVHAAVEIDANTQNGLQVRPVNVEASFKWPRERPYMRTAWAYDPNPSPWFMVTAGLFRPPFAFEVQEREIGRLFLERTTASGAFFPGGFDLGLRIVGGFSFLRYGMGIMNGDPIGERSFPGRDPNESKDFMFRVGFATAVTETIHVEGGVSGLSGRGFHRGKPATKDVLQWRDTNADGIVTDPTELQVVPGTPAEASQNFKRFAVGADLRASWVFPIIGELAVRGEIVRASNLDRGLYVSDPVVATRDLRQLGWHIGASQEVTRWAMVGVRYDLYNPDSDAREQEPFAVVPRDPSISTWAFVGVLRVERARLIGQYDHHTNALGRDASGRPTTLGDDQFTLRAEVRF